MTRIDEALAEARALLRDEGLDDDPEIRRAFLRAVRRSTVGPFSYDFDGLREELARIAEWERSVDVIYAREGEAGMTF